MKKIKILLVIFLISSCSEESDGCECRNALVEGANYKVEVCDEETYLKLIEFGSKKQAQLMQDAANCN